MKLIRQARLGFQQGTSDKVYEVDLCEVGPGQFVVNFRYGKRGGALKEGSKTALPVDQPEADRVFDRLVAEKTGKGYADTSIAVARPAAPPVPTAAPTDETSPRDAQILAILTRNAKAWGDLNRVVFRAGELRLFAAAAPIAAMACTDDRRAWNIARALLRCGDPSTLPTVVALAEDAKRPPWVRWMAVHAALALTEDEVGLETAREALLAPIRAAVPEGIAQGLRAGRYAAIAAEVAEAPELLDQLYVTADPDAFVALLGVVPLRNAIFADIRRIYKVAEATDDGAVFGTLARRFEREPIGGTNPKSRHRRYAAHGTATKPYLRRRTWRALRRLGEAGMAEAYTSLASGILLAYTDEDGGAAVRKRSGYDWRTRTQRYVHYDLFSGDWAFNNILFHHSARYQRVYASLKFRCAPGVASGTATSVREEAFPALWNTQPLRLAEFLDRSRCRQVHGFAARILKDLPHSWHLIPVRRLIGWFKAPYAETAELAAEVAVTRYDPLDPDTELVLALLSCAHATARTTAEGWVRSNPAPFLRTTAFVVGLVLNEQPETRRFALELLGAATLLPQQAKEVVEAVLAAVQRVDAADESATVRLRDAAAILLAAFSQDLKTAPLSLIAELLRHPAEGVAELGAKILLGHDIRPKDLPDDLLAAAMTSVHPVVRGIGIRLYGELPDAVLAERFRVLVHLVTNEHADVRLAVTPIVVRLASSNAQFAKVLWTALVPILCADGAAGLHRDVVRLLRTDLASTLPGVTPAQVFRLLRAKELVVQELAGDLLRTNVDPMGMTPAQLAVLASSDVIGVRRTAFLLLASRIDAIRADPESVLALVDARWEDSRKQAFDFVEQKVGVDALPAEVVLAVCDSVRPDVQAFGRRLVVRLFEHADGPRYLFRMAQHPVAEMQAFAASWLSQHANHNPERLEKLAPFIVTVLARPNQARIAKIRILAFLEDQIADPACAAIVAPLASELALTVAVTYRERYVAMLAQIRRLHPQLDQPLTVVVPEVRGAV